MALKLQRWNSHRKLLSTVKIKKWKFPGGEVGVRIEEDISLYDNFTIYATFGNSDDILLLMMLVDAIRQGGKTQPYINLVAGYIPYGRQDRVCVDGESFSLEVFSGIINSLDFDSVVVVDEHSKITTDLIFGSINILPVSQLDYVEFKEEIPFVVSPDEGANNRAKVYARAMGCPVAFGKKQRDLSTGRIISYSFSEDLSGKSVLVVDDICDGGATFLALAEHLKDCKERVLFVTHGIFSKGFDDLLSVYDRIYTTDTYPMKIEEIPDRVTIIPILNIGLIK